MPCTCWACSQRACCATKHGGDDWGGGRTGWVSRRWSRRAEAASSTMEGHRCPTARHHVT